MCIRTHVSVPFRSGRRERQNGQLQMTSRDKEKVVSLGGDPIFHHGQASDWEAPSGEVCLEQISDHIERHIGKIETVYHELISDTVHIDVHFVKPWGANPYTRLVTSGMSD